MVTVARLLTPPEFVSKLDQHVAGQGIAKRRLATAVYRHYLGLRLREHGGRDAQDLGPQHQLLLGPTGVGKSYLVKCIAKLVGVPTAFTAATSLVETGYVGSPVESVFAALLDQAGGDAALAEQGIVFLDEFDKLRRARDVGRDVSGEGVQNGLLTLLDGRPVHVRQRDREVRIDSSRVLFLCTGAFAGLADVVRRRLERVGPGALGFTATQRAVERWGEAELMAQARPEDLVEYGIIPELVGRFAGIVPHQALTRADLGRILSDVSGSPLGAQERLFELHGVRLEVTSDARGALVERAMAQGAGARALRRVVHEAFADLEFRLPRLVEQGVGAVRVTRAVLEGRGSLELVPRRVLRDWSEPIPSASQLCSGPPATPRRSAALERGWSRPARVEAKPAGTRRKVRARPATPGPTLFDAKS